MMIKAFNTFYRFIARHPYKVAAFCFLLVFLTAGLCAAVDPEYTKYCGNKAINKKYNDAGCWSCDIIYTLMMSMTKVAGMIFSATSQLSMVILGLGSAIWLASYFLKALGSFATQDPAKVIDGVLVFAFKITVIYAMIVSGIDMIVYYIVNPLLSIGYDIGEVFSSGAGL